MSQYGKQVGEARGRREGSVVSVGDTIDTNQVYNSSHPLYKLYSERLAMRMQEIITRESEKQASAQQAVCTVTLPPEDRVAVASEYPELRVVWPEWSVPVHPTWAARRQLLNQYMMHHMSMYASSYVHYGGSALAALTAHVTDTHLRLAGSLPVAVHESFQDDADCARLILAASTAASALGWITNPQQLRDYASKGILRKDGTDHPSGVTAEALLVDGGLYPMSPQQFMLAMLQHECSVGMFAIPFHASMLVHSQGFLPGTDVHYSLDENELRLQYGSGVAGVTKYSARVWNEWLLNQTRVLSQGATTSYQFELMGVRGCFMLIRIVQVDAPSSQEQTIVHSIQLQDNSDYTLIRTWRLRSLASDVTDARSWEPVTITVPTRVLEKTTDYAMALDADQFSRHAIRKRAAVVNDRVVIQGTSVVVQEALTSADLDVFEIAVFTHCFVARYETGRLASHLRKLVDDVAGFGTIGVTMKLCHIMTVCANLAYDWTIGTVDEALRSAFDTARRWLRGDLSSKVRTIFQPAPTFIRYETVFRARMKPVVDAVRQLAGKPLAEADVHQSMPGSRYAYTLGMVASGPSVPIPVIEHDYEVRRNGNDLFSDIVDTSVGGEPSAATQKLIGVAKQLNEFDQDGGSRHMMQNYSVTENVHAQDVIRSEYSFDPGYIATIDDFHDAVVPGMRGVEFKYDPASISTDDQDRSLAAEYLELPLDFGPMPSQMEVYESRLQAYNVTKRPHTTHETLSAFHARNLSAPVLAIPQEDDMLIDEVISDFLDIACVENAREMLKQYATDPVSVEERAMIDWGGKARPDNVLKVVKHMSENPMAWEELRLGRYESMIKTDVKPPLSDKPLYSRVEPQVIVHHVSEVNAIFSSVFRVLVRRFLSLLKPNFMLNLLKDMPQVRDVIQTFHAWGEDVRYLENDFSRYDKSQGRFVYMLESKLFEILGMNAEMLQAWGVGHVDCSIRSLGVGISLSVRYQRKSGDATTAFGNGMLNIMSVVHAYKGSDIIWGVFMGDDSLVAVRTVCCGETAVRSLAEKFNLQAKFFVTDAPYFASNFVLIHEDERRVTCVPDPVKRAEKWSMAVPAREPKWAERYESAVNSLAVYRQRTNLVGLGRAIYIRYGLKDGFEPDAIGDAIASAIRTEKDFRAIWSDIPMTIKF